MSHLYNNMMAHEPVALRQQAITWAAVQMLTQIYVAI